MFTTNKMHFLMAFFFLGQLVLVSGWNPLQMVSSLFHSSLESKLPISSFDLTKLDLLRLDKPSACFQDHGASDHLLLIVHSRVDNFEVSLQS